MTKINFIRAILSGLTLVVSFFAIGGRPVLDATSLILANIVQDMRLSTSEDNWITQYNESIWLIRDARHTEALTSITPLLTDPSVTHRAEVAELYGDLLWTLSGSRDLIKKSYITSLEYHPIDRVEKKLQMLEKSATGSVATGSTQSPPPSTSSSGSHADTASRVQELQKASTMRSEYLRSDTKDHTTSELDRLMQSVRTGAPDASQDW